MQSYEFLKSQGINCLFLINVSVDSDQRKLNAEMVFIPPKLSSQISVTYNGKKIFLLSLPIEQQKLKTYARQVKVRYNILNTTENL